MKQGAFKLSHKPVIHLFLLIGMSLSLQSCTGITALFRALEELYKDKVELYPNGKVHRVLQPIMFDDDNFYEYDSLGNLFCTGYIDDNEQATGIWNFFDSLGNKMVAQSFADGKRSGTRLEFDVNGNIELEANYLNDSLDGAYLVYYPGKSVHSRSMFKNDKRHGEYFIKDSLGKLIEIGRYEHGVCTFKQERDALGEIVSEFVRSCSDWGEPRYSYRPGFSFTETNDGHHMKYTDTLELVNDDLPMQCVDVVVPKRHVKVTRVGYDRFAFVTDRSQKQVRVDIYHSDSTSGILLRSVKVALE